MIHPCIGLSILRSLCYIENEGVVSSAEAADNARIILNVVTAASTFTDDVARLADCSSAGSIKKRKHVPVHIGSDFAYGTLPVPNKGAYDCMIEDVVPSLL